MRILHTADIHLRNDSDHRWHALGAVLEKASELSADVVVISGDLFDRDVDAQQLKTPLRARLESSGARVIVIPGNHDSKGVRAGDFYGERVDVLAGGERVVDAGDARFIALPFSDGGADRTLERLYDAAELCDGTRTNVLLFHGELLDLIPGGGAFGDEEPDYMPVRLSSFDRLGFSYVLAGHFHRSYSVHDFDGGYFVYPGSPVSITQKELGRRRVDVVDVGSPPRPEPVDTRHYEAIRVRLDPFGETHPVDAIERGLSGVHPHAEVILTVDGCVNLAGIGLSETELHAAIKKEVARWQVCDVEARWVDVRDVVDHELFRKFNDHLARRARDGAVAITGERREALQTLVLESLMELVYAR